MTDTLANSMSMPCCSSCGRQMGHLYEDHINLSKKLETELKSTAVPQQNYIGDISGKDITDFVHTYYSWQVKNPNKIKFQPHNIISRGLLSLSPLTEEMLPFGTAREEDNQLSMLSEPVCCLRMLQCDPKFSIPKY